MQKEERNIIATTVTLIVIIAIITLTGTLTLSRTSNMIQGEAEATEYRVSSKVPGRIHRIFVKEGDYVKAGDTLASIAAPDVDARLMQATALEQAAEAFNEKVRQGTRPEEKAAAYEMWQKAVAGTEIARKTFNRTDNLYKEGVVTEQKRDEASALLEAAIATEKAAKAQYELAVKGAESEDKEMAAAKFRQAQGAVEEVDSYVDEMLLTAVRDGEVSDIYPVEGELVGAGAPIMSITYLDDMWVSFNMREDELTHYNIGEKATGYIPALQKNAELTIYYMKDLGTYAVWRATKANGEYDIKTFEVRARPERKIEGLRPGMSVLIDKNRK